MKRFLTYTWPIFVYLALEVLVFMDVPAGYDVTKKSLFFLPLPIDLLVSLGGIYYLRTSPFGKSRNTILTIILICRLIIRMYSYNYCPPIITYFLHTGSELFLFLFYSLRTFEKNNLKVDDYFKLFLCVLITFSLIGQYSGSEEFNTFLFEYGELSIPDNLTDAVIHGNINSISQIIFVILHITMLYRRKDAHLNNHEEQLIETIGKETN